MGWMCSLFCQSDTSQAWKEFFNQNFHFLTSFTLQSMVSLLPVLLINDSIAAGTTVTLQSAFITMTHLMHSSRVRTSDALERVRIPHSVLQLFLDHTHDADYARHHNGHHPEIQVLSATEATGIWYLADNMWVMDHNFFTTGTAIYWDRYLKVDGRWLIKDTRYERIYEISHALEERPPLSAHYLGKHGTQMESSG